MRGCARSVRSSSRAPRSPSPRRQAARTSATGSWSASPSQGRGSSVPTSTGAPRRARRVPAHVPARPRRRRPRRAPERPRDRRRLHRDARQPGQPRDHDLTLGGLPRHVRRAIGRRRDLQARSSAACRQTGGGSRVPTSVSQLRPGRPVTRRVKIGSRAARDDHGQPALRRRRAPRGRLARFRLLDTRTPPSASLVRSVSGLAADRRRQSVVVRVSGDAELAGVRAVVQVQRALLEGRR